MKGCCDEKTDELLALRNRQARVLKWVLAINAMMFAVEATAGLMARSTALLGDALDMFGDAAVYALTLYVIDRGPVWRARAALVKGGLMGVFGLAVLAQAAARLVTGTMPEPGVMGAIGTLALAANVICLALLWRHRSDDLNMRSTWLCSRNDIVANVGVLVAASLVVLVRANWPDVVAGALIAALFLKDAVSVVREALAERRGHEPPGACR